MMDLASPCHNSWGGQGHMSVIELPWIEFFPATVGVEPLPDIEMLRKRCRGQ
ncbi:hypothetical protein K443DRAFT_670822 [Laccaria amethystina LaAM-08-1]|uniref:Unplaced genomic scaffold K443scaffold_1, whole genome shotgun sequence n=1 Tax=Laccaria amethystina LaAM-08-1 TaxID=1095629 RepID=A0A0C9YIP3_9AGAR|nr:hypothetical protein K443DRAFT_670822 [Laccaria amethystina LaAM-08-1]